MSGEFYQDSRSNSKFEKVKCHKESSTMPLLTQFYKRNTGRGLEVLRLMNTFEAN